MKKATLPQATAILDLFTDTPREQVQAILKSGLLADLRDGNLDNVNRDDFRRLLGLSPFDAPAIKDRDQPAPRVRLVQTAKQARGGTVELGEMLEYAARFGRLEGGYEYFKANPGQIPEEWKGKCVFFPETEFRGSVGCRCVRCVCWGDSCWDWDYGWVSGGVHSGGFVAVPASNP